MRFHRPADAWLLEDVHGLQHNSRKCNKKICAQKSTPARTGLAGELTLQLDASAQSKYQYETASRCTNLLLMRKLAKHRIEISKGCTH